MIDVKNLSKTFGSLIALQSVNLSIPEGQFAIVLGRSGAGKSTLLRCLNRLETPTSGEIYIDGRRCSSNREDLRWIRRSVGMIFQHYNVVKRSSVLSNVLHGRSTFVPTFLSLFHIFPKHDVDIALDCLRRVDLEEKVWARADALSGGQQQRVGIARALAQEPRVVLADEPVSSLDPKTARTILRCLQTICRDLGITVVCNLHQIDLAREFGDRVIGMAAGEIVFDGAPSELDQPQILRKIYPGGETEEETDGEKEVEENGKVISEEACPTFAVGR